MCSTRLALWARCSTVSSQLRLECFGGPVLTTAIADGAIGGTAQSIGGPLDKGGMIGKHFNAEGALGGTAQGLADMNKSH